MKDEDITLSKVVKFIESEELANWSLSDTKAAGIVSGLSHKKIFKKSSYDNNLKLWRKCGERAWPHIEQLPCPGSIILVNIVILRVIWLKLVRRKNTRGKRKMRKIKLMDQIQIKITSQMWIQFLP